MRVDGQRLINRKLFKSVIEKLRTREAVALHQWNAKGVIKHFAYLLPEDKRFTETDIEAVISETNIVARPNPFDPLPLNQLVSDGVLVQDFQFRRTLRCSADIPVFQSVLPILHAKRCSGDVSQRIVDSCPGIPNLNGEDVSARLQDQVKCSPIPLSGIS